MPAKGQIVSTSLQSEVQRSDLEYVMGVGRALMRDGLKPVHGLGLQPEPSAVKSWAHLAAKYTIKAR